LKSYKKVEFFFSGILFENFSTVAKIEFAIRLPHDNRLQSLFILTVISHQAWFGGNFIL